MKASSSSSQFVTLSDNYIAEGVSYPRETPVPRELVRPDHLAELEVRPGASSQRIISGAAANLVPGVSYRIGEDGQPIRTPETAAAEERAFKAQREREEVEHAAMEAAADEITYYDPRPGQGSVEEPS